ncbi:MAG: hypothetical protein U0W40_04220 [Acidimicrobiia bacterium]
MGTVAGEGDVGVALRDVEAVDRRNDTLLAPGATRSCATPSGVVALTSNQADAPASSTMTAVPLSDQPSPDGVSAMTTLVEPRRAVRAADDPRGGRLRPP